MYMCPPGWRPIDRVTAWAGRLQGLGFAASSDGLLHTRPRAPAPVPDSRLQAASGGARRGPGASSHLRAMLASTCRRAGAAAHPAGKGIGDRRDARAEQAPGGSGMGRVSEHAGGGKRRAGQRGGAGFVELDCLQLAIERRKPELSGIAGSCTYCVVCSLLRWQ